MQKINSKIKINNNSSKIDWEKISEDIKIKLGNDIFNSWIQKLKLVEEMDHYIVLSAPTRFIRDWVVSRYLDQIIKIVKNIVILFVILLIFLSPIANKLSVKFLPKLFSSSSSQVFKWIGLTIKALLISVLYNVIYLFV